MATLVAALACFALWIGFLAGGSPNGWIHVPLALGVILLVRWIAVRR
ncbi:MAG TPA: hypothetical protein VFW66_00955 [Gemmatimonadales bacterium]|nr:hypothetical protein [Gemmatimonadales bacterium]